MPACFAEGAPAIPPQSSIKGDGRRLAPEVRMSQLLTTLQILCVDDHADTLEILRYMLEMRGSRVCIASTAHDAFEILRNFAPRIVITDVCLPDMDGVAAIGTEGVGHGPGT